MPVETLRQRVALFLADLWHDWIALLSGVASVALMALGASFQTTLPPWLFWPASYMCLAFAAYRVWSREHGARTEREGDAAELSTLRNAHEELQHRHDGLAKERGALAEQAHELKSKLERALRSNPERNGIRKELQQRLGELRGLRSAIASGSEPAVQRMIALHFQLDNYLRQYWPAYRGFHAPEFPPQGAYIRPEPGSDLTPFVRRCDAHLEKIEQALQDLDAT